MFRVVKALLHVILCHAPTRRRVGEGGIVEFDFEFDCSAFVHCTSCLTWVVLQDGCPVDKDIFAGVAAVTKPYSFLTLNHLTIPVTRYKSNELILVRPPEKCGAQRWSFQ